MKTSTVVLVVIGVVLYVEARKRQAETHVTETVVDKIKKALGR